MIRKTIMIRKTRLYPILAALLALVAVPATGFAQVAFQDSNVMSFSTGEAISGGATLSRSANSVQLRGSIAGLDKKGVYSAWWIIFNNPAACGNNTGVCTGADVFPGGPADPGVLNASGFVTGTDGTGYFVGELESGPAPAGMAGFGQLNDSITAEIHIVFQSHGNAVPGTVAFEMTHPTGIDQYFAVFLPPAL